MLSYNCITWSITFVSDYKRQYPIYAILRASSNFTTNYSRRYVGLTHSYLIKNTNISPTQCYLYYLNTLLMRVAGMLISLSLSSFLYCKKKKNTRSSVLFHSASLNHLFTSFISVITLCIILISITAPLFPLLCLTRPFYPHIHNTCHIPFPPQRYLSLTSHTCHYNLPHFLHD